MTFYHFSDKQKIQISEHHPLKIRKRPLPKPIVPNNNVTTLYLINSTSDVFQRNFYRATILNLLEQYVPDWVPDFFYIILYLNYVFINPFILKYTIYVVCLILK